MDLPNEIKNTKNTRFASASAGKAFVAVAIMKLVEKGMISLATTIGETLTEIDFKAIDKHITVKQLLNHTSGIPDYFDESVMNECEDLWIEIPNYRIRKNSDLIPLFIDKPMMYPRGTKFQYNNTGYVALALIIEKITKMPFDDFISETIFDKCEMNDCGYFELDRLPNRCANNYILSDDDVTYKTNIFSVDAKGTGAGGAFISVQDIHKFWNSFYNGKIISKEFVLEMITPQNSDDSSPYGFGFWLVPTTDGFIPAFQGSDPGVSFFTEYNFEKDITSILVSNYGDNVWQEMRNIRKELYY